MSRSRVAWLIAVAALLVADGPRSDPRADAYATGAGAGAALSEVRVRDYLAVLNPELSSLERRRIAAAVLKFSAKYELDPALVLAVIRKESTGRPWVRSPKGAVGLMQVMPHMMGALPVAGNLTSIESNVEAGCMILADNIRRLGEHEGIRAYFWGNRAGDGGYVESVQRARAAILEPAAES